MKKILIFICLIVIQIFQLQAQSSTAKIEMVMDGEGIYSPWILEEANVMRMYFGGWLIPEDTKSGDKLFYAESSDNGTTWGAPIRITHVDGHSFNDPTVVKLSSTKTGKDNYLMYFTDRVHAESSNEPNPQVSLSTSDDGKNWKYHGIVIPHFNGYDTNSAWCPSAIVPNPTEDTVYVYYHTRFSQGRVLRSTMVDGGTRLLETKAVITKEQDSDLKTNVTVVKEGSEFVMVCNQFYKNSSNQTSSQLVRWLSPDEEHWSKSPAFVLYEEDGKWLGSPFIQKQENGWMLYFGRGNITFPRQQKIYRLAVPESVITEISTVAAADNNVKLFPNPVQNQLNVNFTVSTSQNVVFEIYSMEGRTISSKSFGASSGNNLISVPTNNLSEGIYTYILKGSDSILLRGQVVK